MRPIFRSIICAMFFVLFIGYPVSATTSHYTELADVPFKNGYPSNSDITALKEEIFSKEEFNLIFGHYPH